MAKSILILMMLLLVLCSVSAVDDDAVLETVSTESQDVIAVENIAADDANSSTVDVASEHNDVFKASGDGNVLDVSDDEGALKDSDNLKIRDSASGETETVSSSSTTVTMDIYHKSMASSYFYYIIDGTREYDVVYRTSMFDFGGDWVSEALTYTFASEGPHTIQLTTNDGGTTSNTINYVIGESSDPQGPGEASNPEAHTSPLPDYYIRFFDNDEDEFQNVQFLDGWDTLNVDMLTKLYAGDGSNSFPSSVYPGSASSTTAYGYLDGSQYGSSYILTNGTSTSYLYNYQISFSNVGSGIHTFYSTYTYNGVTYYSNVYYFYVGDAYQEYETTLNL